MRVQAAEYLAAYLKGQLKTKGKDVVWWQEIDIHAETEYDQAWLVCFFNGVLFLCATGQAVESIRSKASSDRLTSSIVDVPASEQVREMVLPKDARGNYILPPRLVDLEE